jgi:hypothetical protein
MPTPTYTPLANITLGSSAATVTFGSIPATYRDLIVILTGTVVTTTNYVIIRLNGDTGGNYSAQALSGAANAAAAVAVLNPDGTTTVNSNYGTQPQSANPIQTILNIMDYSATDKHKTILVRSDQADNGYGPDAIANRWANTAAVTSISFAPNGQSWAAGATFSLYGVIA